MALANSNTPFNNSNVQGTSSIGKSINSIENLPAKPKVELNFGVAFID